LLVANPFAEELTFLDHQTRTRRDHMKYLTLIRAIALLHQYQRPVKTTEHRGEVVKYIEVTRDDIALANRLSTRVLGTTLDELPPQTRRLLELVRELVVEQTATLGLRPSEYRFTRRDVREWTAWGDTQLKVLLGRLVELELLVVHRAGHAQRRAYELVYAPAEGDGEGERWMSGLIDVDALGNYDGNRSGSEANRSAPDGDRSGAGRAAVGGWSGSGRGSEGKRNEQESRSSVSTSAESAPETHRGKRYRSNVVPLASSSLAAEPRAAEGA
jgi:hypothetical protein